MFNAAASSAVHNRERARTVDSAQGSDRSHSVSPATSSASLASAQPGSARSAMEPNAENSRERIFLPPPPPAPQPPADEGGGIGRRRRATTTTTEGATRLRRQTATEVGVGQDTLDPDDVDASVSPTSPTSKSVFLRSLSKPDARPSRDQDESRAGGTPPAFTKRMSTMRKSPVFRSKDLLGEQGDEGDLSTSWSHTDAHGAKYPTSTLKTVGGKESKKGVLDPSAKIMVRWDLATTLCLFFTIFVTPYEVAFLETKLNALFWINRFVDLIFTIDIGFTFHLMYVDAESGKWVASLARIRQRYLSTTFVPDFVSVLPFDVVGVIVEDQAVSDLKILRIIKLIKLAKLMRILRAGRLLRQIENAYPINYGVMQLVGFLLSVVLAGHWLACMFRMTVALTTDDVTVDTNWILRMKQDGDIPPDATVYDEYIVAYYWAIMTMTTIGYGDVPLTTTEERFVCILGMMLGTAFYTYIIGAVTGIVTALNMKHREFYQRCDAVNKFCQSYKLPNEMRHKLREYFRFKHSKQGLYDYHELLEEMSPGLQREVAVITQMHWVKSLKFFNHCNQAFLADLVMRLSHVHFPQEEVFIHVGDLPLSMYVIVSGIVLHEGKVFCSWGLVGEDMVYSKQRRMSKARALTFVNAFELSHEQLAVCFEKHPEDARIVRKYAVYRALRLEILAYAKAKRLHDEARAAGAVDVQAYVMRTHYVSDGSSMWSVPTAKFALTDREQHYLSKLTEEENRLVAALKIQRMVKTWRKAAAERKANVAEGKAMYAFPAWVTRTAEMLSNFDGDGHMEVLMRRQANMVHQLALHQSSLARSVSIHESAQSKRLDKLTSALGLLLKKSGMDPTRVFGDDFKGETNRSD